jgi:hypothetical protein
LRRPGVMPQCAVPAGKDHDAQNREREPPHNE